MSVQDKLERTLREIHVMVSHGREVPGYEEYVLLYKKDMLKLLDALNDAVSEMMDEYEVTEQSRARGEREAERRREEKVREANRQAEDIYAASVLYTDDALGRIQDIIENAGKSMKQIMEGFGKEIDKEKKKVRSNQRELKSQLEDLKDTSKYIRIIEERNKEIAKAKMKKEEKEKPEKYQRKEKPEPDFVPLSAEIKINEEYFERAGLTPDGIPIIKDEPVYEKPEIKINEEYFRRAGIPLEGEEKETSQAKGTASRVIGRKQTIAEALAEARGEKFLREEERFPRREEKFSREEERFPRREEKFSRKEEMFPGGEEIFPGNDEKFSRGQELTKEEDAAIDAEMEAILKASLDAEYFQWIGGEEPEDKQEKKGLARFLKNT
ncbi:MAG: hypothetical protein NC307_09090 [Roseburia sp.]|nr:hypothetical protein [Roseburia sp.]